LIPLLFMGDVIGRLFREFAVTLSVTIFVSAIVSLTLTPMMCALLLKTIPKHVGSSRDHGTQGWLFIGLLRFYETTLRWTLKHQGLTMLVFLATLAATVFLYIQVPKGFFPIQDTGVILGITQSDQDTSFTRMKDKQAELNAVLCADPAVESIASFIGIDSINLTLNSGRIQINLKPHHERHESIQKVMARLSQNASAVSGIQLFMQPVQDLSVESRVSRTQYQYSLETPDPEQLSEWVPKLVTKLKDRPELQDVASDQAVLGREAKLIIDRDTASRLGVTPLLIDDALYNAFGQRQVSTIFTQLNQYRVVLEVAPEFRDSLSDIGALYVKTNTGRPAPLDSLTNIEYQNAPLAINHQGQFPVVTVSFNVAPGVSLGQAVEAVEETVREIQMPAGIVRSFQGSAEAYQRSLSTTPLLILAALITVYIVLGVLYESFVHPLTILSTLPSAGLGALVALILFRLDLSIIALIGIILLIGIVKKNAIMMIDFALEAQRNQGLQAEDAIFHACLLRLRPILMTTMAALLGAVPLAFSGGVGSEIRQPLGICIIGGLIFSQALTLYTTPVIYLWFDALGRRKGKPEVS
jgi:multidrug efflux pump